MNSTKQNWLLGEYHYPTYVRVMELIGIFAYVIFASLTAQKTSQNLMALSAQATWIFWGLLVLAPPVAYLLGDFMSGLVHCAADNFGEETTPFFGPAFIRPFRDHHRDPEGITRHDFVEVNGNSCQVNLIVLVPCYFILLSSPTLWITLASVFALFFTLSIVLTNQIHKWAHQTTPPGFVRLFQKAHLVLTPQDHSIHHTPPFDRYYCITNGWLNAVLEKVGFFTWLVETFDWARPESTRVEYSQKMV